MSESQPDVVIVGAGLAGLCCGKRLAECGVSFRILEASYQLRIPRMFAALALISAAGIAIFALLGAVQHVLLRHWHESAMKAER